MESFGVTESFGVMESFRSRNQQGWKSPLRSPSPSAPPALPRPPRAMSPSATSPVQSHQERGLCLAAVPGLESPSRGGISPISHLNLRWHTLKLFPLILILSTPKGPRPGRVQGVKSQLWERLGLLELGWDEHHPTPPRGHRDPAGSAVLEGIVVPGCLRCLWLQHQPPKIPG